MRGQRFFVRRGSDSYVIAILVRRAVSRTPSAPAHPTGQTRASARAKFCWWKCL